MFDLVELVVQLHEQSAWEQIPLDFGLRDKMSERSSKGQLVTSQIPLAAVRSYI